MFHWNILNDSRMSVKEVEQKACPRIGGVLCDDCKRKQNVAGESFKSQKETADGTQWLIGSTVRMFWFLFEVFAKLLPLFSKLLFLLPLLLFVGLWYWGPNGLWSGSNKSTASVKDSDAQPLLSCSSDRLMRVEGSVSQLWDRVTAALLQQEAQHRELLRLYNTLHTDRESLNLLIRDVLEQKLHNNQQLQEEHRSEKTRLADAEDLLQTLMKRTEDVTVSPEMELPTPSPHSEDTLVESPSKELLVEVNRLELSLGQIRNEVQEQLDSLSVKVSEQVTNEVKSLFYGSVKEGQILPESLQQWLLENFVDTEELQESLDVQKRKILSNLTGQCLSEDIDAQTLLEAAGLAEEHVQGIVQEALQRFAEDRTGLVDYALESAGGSILSTGNTESHEANTTLLSLFGVPLWFFSQSPRTVIQPNVHPGNCWAFKGAQGELFIRLSMEVVPTAFTMEHIPKSLTPTGSISSAPREFMVFGLDFEHQQDGQALGDFEYKEDGEALQTFNITVEISRRFQIIELRVLSNWGHPVYTCLYRFRVHGNVLHSIPEQ